jgi:TonB family protein
VTDSIVNQPSVLDKTTKPVIVEKPKLALSQNSDQVQNTSSATVDETKPPAEQNVAESKGEVSYEKVTVTDAKDVKSEPEADKIAKTSAPIQKAEVEAMARAKETRFKKSVQEKILRGQVLSAEDGSPIPGVNVVVKGTTHGTVTDADGNYQLKTEDGNQPLVFSFIGYQTQEVAVANDRAINVNLGSDLTALSEVVVVGYGVNKDDGDREPIIKEAQPIGGRRAYNKYLDTDLRYPVEALENKIKGKVTIKFTVLTTGELDEFTVVKSLGHGCDEEVMRLVKAGPKWTPTTEDNVPVESEVLVKVRFDPAKAKR